MTAERAAAPVEDDVPATVEPPGAGSTAGLVAVSLTLPFIGASDPVPTATIPAEIADLLGETVSPAANPGGSVATGRPPIR